MALSLQKLLEFWRKMRDCWRGPRKLGVTGKMVRLLEDSENAVFHKRFRK